jgi:NADH pyrophosphatase NudC (nudix superfamily)
VLITGVCGLAVALVFLFLWLGSRSDAHTTSNKLAATQQTLHSTAKNLKASKLATTAANATLARERDALATANGQLADAQQRGSGLQNSIEGYKLCGADLGKFFVAVQADNEAQITSTLLTAKIDCDRIDPTIIPLTP